MKGEIPQLYYRRWKTEKLEMESKQEEVNGRACSKMNKGKNRKTKTIKEREKKL